MTAEQELEQAIMEKNILRDRWVQLRRDEHLRRVVIPDVRQEIAVLRKRIAELEASNAS